MKHVLIIFGILPLLWGCGDSAVTSSESWSVAIDSTSAHQRAWVLCDNDAPAEEYIAMQRQAVEDLRAGRSKDDPVEVLAQMGLFYNYVGDYRQGISYLQEAETWIHDHPEYKPGEGAIQLYGDLGDLYRILGMIPESKEAFRKGFELSDRLGGRLSSDLYCFAAAVYDAVGDADSVMYCYDMALKAIDEGKTRADKNKLRESVMLQRADYMIESGLYPDSLDACVKTLESLNHPDAWFPAMKSAALGNAYIAQGKVKEGVALLEEAVAELREIGDIDTEMLYMKPLMTAYAKNGMSQSLLNEFLRYDELNDTILNHEKLDAVTGADLRYQTSRVRAENEVLEMKMSMMRQRVVYGLIIAVLVIIGIMWFFVTKRRNDRREINEKTAHINNLLDDRIMLNTRIEQLNTEVEERHAAEEKLQLQPVLLEKRHEEDFRHTFSELHPGFIDGLRRDFPGVTSGQEIICMLIYLYKTNEEIALALGISRDSVVKSRYRIRQRFNMESDADLDSFIRGR